MDEEKDQKQKSLASSMCAHPTQEFRCEVSHKVRLSLVTPKLRRLHGKISINIADRIVEYCLRKSKNVLAIFTRNHVVSFWCAFLSSTGPLFQKQTRRHRPSHSLTFILHRITHPGQRILSLVNNDISLLEHHHSIQDLTDARFTHHS